MIKKCNQQKLCELLEFFIEENTKLNLSALWSEEQCWHGNILDSLSLIGILPTLFVAEKKGRKCLDIGTGGGFPLLPLAIELPAMHFTGLDATKKKLEAVERIAKKLDLHNVSFACGRLEALAHHPALREQFDLVTARGVAPLSVLLEYAVPFLTVGGKCVFWKSMHIADEQRTSAAAMKLLHVSFKGAHEYTLEKDWGTRQLLIYEKESRTEERYPREVGMPKKNPL